MMQVEILPAEAVHVQQLLQNQREFDLEYRTRVKDPLKFMLREINDSEEAWTGFIAGEVVCIWGIKLSSLLSRTAFLWMCTSKSVEEHPFFFVRQSQIMLQKLLRSYTSVEGFVLTSNVVSIKWLKWLGCEIIPSANPGILNFEIRSH